MRRRTLADRRLVFTAVAVLFAIRVRGQHSHGNAFGATSSAARGSHDPGVRAGPPEPARRLAA